MTSYEYAAKLANLAEFLNDRPEFELPGYTTEFHEHLTYFNDKERFLKAVHALGSGTKAIVDDNVNFRPSVDEGIVFQLSINRDRVCRKVQDAVWECEPLLSTEEEAQVGK